jgi:hypothetical protein
MRAILLILILGIVVLIAAVATGLLDISTIRGAKAPTIAATGNGVVATGGRAPAFDIETGTVAVGSKPANVTVQVPALEVQRAGGADQQRPANSVQGNGM